MSFPTDLEKPEYSEPAFTKLVDRTQYPFYIPNIDKKLIPETCELLEKYSLIPPEQQSAHVHKIRDQAWEIRVYPCTGLGTWLVPQLCRLPVYPEILRRVKAGQKLMDVGCFVGHDLRRLVYDDAPSSNLYGVDIVSHWEVGYELFRDREQFAGNFIEADFLSDAPALVTLKGQIDIISCSQVLHQWNWDGQIKAAIVLASFTKPGSMIVGNQIGNSRAQEVPLNHAPIPLWRHNPDSLKKLWSEVGSKTGTKWEVQAWMRTFEEMSWDKEDGAWMEDGVGIIEFAVRRLQ